MAGNSDGSVIIDTSLDLDGIEKAAKEFLKAVDDKQVDPYMKGRLQSKLMQAITKK